MTKQKHDPTSLDGRDGSNWRFAHRERVEASWKLHSFNHRHDIGRIVGKMKRKKIRSQQWFASPLGMVWNPNLLFSEATPQLTYFYSKRHSVSTYIVRRNLNQSEYSRSLKRALLKQPARNPFGYQPWRDKRTFAVNILLRLGALDIFS